MIPYFSPAEKTQVIIINPGDDFFRIYEHDVKLDDQGVQNLNMKRVKKIVVDNLKDKIDVPSIHTAVATKNSDFIALIDR